LDEKSSKLISAYNIIYLSSLDKDIEELKNIVFELYAKKIFIFESGYEQYFKKKINNLDNVKNDIESKKNELEKELFESKNRTELIEILAKNTVSLLKFIENKNKKQELGIYTEELEVKVKVSKMLEEERKRLEKKIEDDVKAFFMKT